ncbi:hypothetical protein FDF18_03180 [Clostridium sporogenes]|uniref:hypothetical protein n=1 Tax=Clostridium sporogenes TaxID=1509 RepID=UPI0013C76213|nr:hypothetical protein [Clostridium sporogenes]MDS1005612.1 hypothetical protein [Clostridium sporogenes]NFQ02096.1 hypothetical protein [Clostridium sporogenes]NFQ40470.1 hypothetical protein [Clostridium sporogenes]NFT02339.1 hypothetical protein [Clostridium sporogenes]NFT29968.1 hypothetical protein [Clostridium sporogenes]
MQESNFIRFVEVIKVKSKKRVVSITVRPLITKSTGSIYFTDLQLQEGDKLTGYTPHTEAFLKHSPNPARFHNGVVRSGDTIIIFNLGETSSGLDCYIYPLQTMEAGSIQLSQGMGSHKVKFDSEAYPGDEFALKASTRECLRNGYPTPKHGFYQYTAATDSKHHVKLQDRKSARVYFEYKEMLKGDLRP